MKKQQIFINAIMAVIQTIIIGIVLFILYRFLLNTIGVKQLGIWSLVLATTSITQIANLGLSGGVIKFVAKYIAREEKEKVSGVIQTATISIGVFIGLILIVCYPFAKGMLKLIVPQESFSSALIILPYAFLSLWIMAISSIFSAGLDGYQRIDIRSFLLMGAAILNLLLCIILAPTYGLIGVAYARVIQNFTILIISWLLLKRCLPILPVFPFKWNRNLFKEMLRYGINLQIISVSVMFYDPVTKALLSKFGGLSMVGYYEMASRMVAQFRLFLTSANQVIIPEIANLQEKIPEKIKSVYKTSYQLIFYLALPLYSSIIICTPFISELWIGHYEKIFISFAILLSIGQFLSTLASPAYYVNLGIGNLRWNVTGYVFIALLNTGLGFLLGIFYNGTGVVVAWIISLAIGSSIICISYHINHKIPLSELLPQRNRIIFIICVIAILFSSAVRERLSGSINILSSNILVPFSFLIIIFISLWLHPMRKRLMGWITNEVLN